MGTDLIHDLQSIVLRAQLFRASQPKQLILGRTVYDRVAAELKKTAFTTDLSHRYGDNLFAGIAVVIDEINLERVELK